MNATLRKLRPAKVRSALRRRHFQWRLARLPIESGPPIVELGTAYGGWKIPDDVLSAGQICYCVGAGGDISFDLELIHRYGAVVRAVDPVEVYERQALASAAGEPLFSFRRAALSTSDGPLRMQTHHQSETDSLSGAGLYDTDSWVEVPGITLHSLMHEFGDKRIDLLKIDVEGSEYELVATLDLKALGVKIFCVQLHHNGTVREALSLIEGVRQQGFRLVADQEDVRLIFLARSWSAS